LCNASPRRLRIRFGVCDDRLCLSGQHAPPQSAQRRAYRQLCAGYEDWAVAQSALSDRYEDQTEWRPRDHFTLIASISGLAVSYILHIIALLIGG